VLPRKPLTAALACVLAGVSFACLWESAWRAPVAAQVPSPTQTPAAPGTCEAAASAATPGAAIAMRAYRVKPGDSLSQIARRFDVPLADLIQLNSIAVPDRIYPDQELAIPGGATPAPAQLAAMAGDDEDEESLPLAQPVAGVGAVNGVPAEQFVLIPAAVQKNIQAIYAQGQALHNDPHAFSKIGDSNMENPYFLAPFDGGAYRLGDYAYLQPVIDQFAGSFGRQSMAVRKGFHSWSVLDAKLADQTACQPGETPVACELRLNQPSLALIRLGTNDAGYPELLRQKLQTIVDECVRQGVIPILGTKADRVDGPEDANNGVVRQLAARNAIPLWDFDLIAQTMPGRGLGPDRVHLTILHPLDYTLPQAFQHGHSADNLAVLMVLQRVWQEAAQAPDISFP
jgi:LysM repeat protein